MNRSAPAMRLRLRLAPLWLAAVVLFAPAEKLLADDGPDPVASGRKALATQTRLPWYDPATDAVQPIGLAPEYRSQGYLPWLTLLGMISLGLLLGLLAYLILRAALNRGGGLPQLATAKINRILEADQVESLPFMADRSHCDLLDEAKRHYQLGNFSEAIIYLFSYELVELDKSSLIHLAKGKTNRQYLREVSRTRQLKQLLESTMITFEDVFFGRRPLDRQGFEACWNQLSEFETLLSQAPT
ncbi:MAG: DUF4129 domain-containing protein [Planctomycetia bacterium]|nr:DUF4129 domain-containing protein [Planctomycetia bacterium]